MRSGLDRLRHALMFEILALAIVIPIGAMIFGVPMTDFGVVGVVSATIAMAWNYVYNLGFDLILKRRRGTTLKTKPIRVVHAVLFEVGLLFALIPFIAWYLEIDLWTAFVMDIAIAGFYLVYALVFNWTYDVVFPLPEWREDASKTA
ncbi:PACE efflux transporter [Thalassorhabdomicrobium marinisediminis]|uniref:PACE efflux transporter n=1 Tax=Thalassorhabdomicrobium marinisediminis TaxID=2170577 RepID=UPI002492507C|nr:PACE efflux transporter [Thalassorhabdomicrobium marinisediminis]